MSARFSVFSHLSSPKTESYRGVLEVFAQARSEFVIQMRPAEIARKLRLDAETIEPALEQLAEWGNLDRHRDHVDASSVEEFYRVKWLYQLSGRGEAAERALEIFENSVEQPGELQTEALRDIIEYLESLRRLLAENPHPATADSSKILRQFNVLNDRFEEFTVQAQRFMRFLQTAIELHGMSLEDFIDYKDKLIEYLERFVSELITSTNEIERGLTELEKLDIRTYFPALAKQARIDALDRDDQEKLLAEEARRLGRWEGLRGWFIGTPGTRSQAETLRARAREAIPALLLALQNFHDRRETGSDRRRDWMTLATWFAELPDDTAAHRLWRVAFALAPSRHLRVNEETLVHRDRFAETTRTSWLKAEPMWLEPQLRKSGCVQRSGRAAAIVDLSAEREILRQLSEKENAQIARAHGQLLMSERLCLADFEALEPMAFELLIELLGRAVADSAGRGEDDFPVETQSTDGSLAIRLWPPEDNRTATLETPHGEFHGKNFRVQITRSA